MMTREAIMMMRVCDDDCDSETVDAHHHGLVPPDLPPLITDDGIMCGWWGGHILRRGKLTFIFQIGFM